MAGGGKATCEQKCQEVAEAETVHNEAIKATLEKTEALETHVKAVTMRAESSATTDADFFQTLPKRQEETQRNLNELCTQTIPQSLHTARITPRKKPSTRTRSSAHEAQGSVCHNMARESGEWWFDVHPKGAGKRRPNLIDEFCSGSSEWSNTSDATTARWNEAFKSRHSEPVRPSGPLQKQSLDRRDAGVGVSS